MKCESCGTSDWDRKQFVKMRDEARFWREQFQRANVEIATMKAEQRLNEFRDRTDVAWLQSKVVSQKRELKRLNDSLNALRIENGMEPKDDVTAESITLIEVRSQAHEIPTEKQGR